MLCLLEYYFIPLKFCHIFSDVLFCNVFSSNCTSPSPISVVYSGGWTITGTAFDLRDPRILAVAQNHILEAEYDDYSATNASTAAFCRSAALVVSNHITYVFYAVGSKNRMAFLYILPNTLFTFSCLVNGSLIVETRTDSN